MFREFSSMNQALNILSKDLLNFGNKVTPRNLETLEILGCSFRLNNPRARQVTIRSRKWSQSLAVGELCWHLSSSNNVEFITYYAKNWKTFSDDGFSIKESCYGRKIFSETGNFSNEWEILKKKLKRDKDTRRAMITLYDSSKSSKLDQIDVSCISNIHFFIRNNRLNCITNMRSNDLIWGLCYDVFFITMLQEMLALELDIEVGWYQHNCNSLHIYLNFLEMTEKIAMEEVSDLGEMAIMEELWALKEFLLIERKLRCGDSEGIDEAQKLPTYWRYLADPLIKRHERSYPSKS